MTIQEVREVLDRIKVKPGSPTDWAWAFDVRQVSHLEDAGFILYATFLREDTNTGVFGVGNSRAEYLSPDCSVEAIIKTAWVVYDMTVRHESMEAFLVDDYRLFDPHASVDELIGFQAERQAER